MITFTRCFISLIKPDPILKILYSINVAYPSQKSSENNISKSGYGNMRNF